MKNCAIKRVFGLTPMAAMRAMTPSKYRTVILNLLVTIKASSRKIGQQVGASYDSIAAATPLTLAPRLYDALGSSDDVEVKYGVAATNTHR